MESIQKTSDTVKGTEVLFFEDVELSKTKNGNSSFSSLGSLSVLYFDDYSRFVLHVNDWRYPLLRRLTVRGTGQEGNSHTYEFPTRNGFTYRLKINSVPNKAILFNFEHILNSNSNFVGKDLVNTEKKRESSPNDKVTGDYMKEGRISTDKVKEVLKHSFDKLKSVTKSKPKTENLTSRTKRIDIKNLKNKNFRKQAKSTFKKDFFMNNEKQTRQFLDMRRSNPNNSEIRDAKDLVRPSGSMGPTVYLKRIEVEEVIFLNKEMGKGTTTQGKTLGQKTPEKKTIMETLKQGFADIKESVSEFMGMHNPTTTTTTTTTTTSTTQERGREGRSNVEQQKAPTTMTEGTMHG